jgi:hypothetical protein
VTTIEEKYLTINESAVKLIKDKETAKEVRSNIHKLIKIQDDKGKFDEDGYTILHKMSKLYKNWPFHNLIAHPVSELVYWVVRPFGRPMAKTAGDWIHDSTLPAGEDNSQNEE